MVLATIVVAVIKITNALYFSLLSDFLSLIIHVHVLVSKLPESRDHESFISAFSENFLANNKQIVY